MKRYVLILLMSFTISAFAQNEKKVEYTQNGELTEAVYYYENGSIEQQGTFNAEGELHGIWTSFDIEGNKIAVGNYQNGRKVGKWFFWSEDVLREVDYFDSKIISVNEWAGKTRVAIRN